MNDSVASTIAKKPHNDDDADILALIKGLKRIRFKKRLDPSYLHAADMAALIRGVKRASVSEKNQTTASNIFLKQTKKGGKSHKKSHKKRH